MRRMVWSVVAALGVTACGAASHDDGAPAAAGYVEPYSTVQDPNSPHFGLNMPNGWVELPVPVRLSAAFSAAQSAMIRRAMRTWELAVGKPLFAVEEEPDARTGDDFGALYDTLDDTTNGIYTRRDWDRLRSERNPLDRKDSAVLATTIWRSPDSDLTRINRADVTFNEQNYTLGDSLVDGSTGNRIIVDLQTTALHELGHFLGLAHVRSNIDATSAMVFEVFVGEGLTQRLLSDGDLTRIQKIYGCEDDACDHEKALAAIAELVGPQRPVAKVSASSE